MIEESCLHYCAIHYIINSLDRTVQETPYIISLRKSIIIRKAPIESGTKRLCASRAQNDTLEAARSHSTQLRSEKFKAQREEILMHSLLNLRDSILSLFL